MVARVDSFGSVRILFSAALLQETTTTTTDDSAAESQDLCAGSGDDLILLTRQKSRTSTDLVIRAKERASKIDERLERTIEKLEAKGRTADIERTKQRAAAKKTQEADRLDKVCWLELRSRTRGTWNALATRNRSMRPRPEIGLRNARPKKTGKLGRVVRAARAAAVVRAARAAAVVRAARAAAVVRTARVVAVAKAARAVVAVKAARAVAVVKAARAAVVVRAAVAAVRAAAVVVRAAVAAVRAAAAVEEEAETTSGPAASRQARPRYRRATRVSTSPLSGIASCAPSLVTARAPAALAYKTERTNSLPSARETASPPANASPPATVSMASTAKAGT